MINKNQRIKVEYKRGKLVISIGVSTLAFAFENSEFAKPYNEKARSFTPVLKVNNPYTFAEDVIRELTKESENGTTRVHLLLDAACEAAADNGSLGVEEVK